MIVDTSLGFVIAAIGTWFVRRHALAHKLLDVPNARSSHQVPTPRGGGIALVAAIAVAVLAGHALSGDRGGYELLPLAGLFMVAAIGWHDDRAGAGVSSRLGTHAAAALTLLPLVPYPHPLPEWFGVSALLLWTFSIVAAINVANFMDGIDGLVVSQTLIFGSYAAFLVGGDGTAGSLGLVLAASSAGFLIWNWSPAKIFMGDVGSGALGFAMVWLGALAAREAPADIIVVFLPLYPLFLDAFVTLLRRMWRGERITQAHRSHLYQRLANGGWGHARVSLLYASAAIVGLGVALGQATRAWPWVVLGYFAFVFVAGWWLERGAVASGQRASVVSGCTD